MESHDVEIADYAFQVRGTFHELMKSKSRLDQFLIDHQLTDRDRFSILITFEEVVLNILNDSWIRADERTISVEVLVGFDQDHSHGIHGDRHGEVCMRVVDNGPPFNLLAHRRPRCELLAEVIQNRGMGIPLVHGLMDEIRYDRIGSENVLSLTKVVQNPLHSLDQVGRRSAL